MVLLLVVLIAVLIGMNGRHGVTTVVTPQGQMSIGPDFARDANHHLMIVSSSSSFDSLRWLPSPAPRKGIAR